MTTFGDIFSGLRFEDVFAEYAKHYDPTHRERVLAVFRNIQRALPAANPDRMTVFIRVLREETLVEAFDPDDNTLFFDVCAIDDTYDGLWSVASSPYGELLGYWIREDTLAAFRPEQLTAHILEALDW